MFAGFFFLPIRGEEKDYRLGTTSTFACESSKRITHDEGTRGLHPEFDKIIIVLLLSS